MRALLLTTSHSYRNEAFQRAAARLDIDLVYGTNQRPLPGQMLPPDQLPLTYEPVEGAAAAIEAFARRHPIDAILAVDDSGVVLAAQAAARLGLAHNGPQAAAAVRDKFLMRSLMAAAGVPCPWFRRFSTKLGEANTAAGRVCLPSHCCSGSHIRPTMARWCSTAMQGTVIQFG